MAVVNFARRRILFIFPFKNFSGKYIKRLDIKIKYNLMQLNKNYKTYQKS